MRLHRREGEADLQVSNSDGAVTVDCNVARRKRLSLKGDSAMYKALMWAAARGQIEGPLESPARNSSSNGRNPGKAENGSVFRDRNRHFLSPRISREIHPQREKSRKA